MGPSLLLAAFVQTALTLDVTVDYEKPSISGRASITVENRGDTAAQRLSLLLGRLMRATSVSSGGKALRFEQEVVVFEDEPLRQVRQLRIDLPARLEPGQRATVDVEYAGALVGYAETGMLYVKDHVDPEFTILRWEAGAFPVVGVPSRSANKAVPESDFAFDVTVRVPKEQVVAAGGALVSRSPWRYRSDGAPFLNISIAPYLLRESGGIRVFVLPGDAATAEPMLKATGRALELLRRWYGPLDREPRLTIAEIPEGYGSQTNLEAGVILVRDTFISPDRRQLYHELSHIWNAPDLDAPSPRWNEGLATYLEYRLAREIDGVDRTAKAVAWSRKHACERAPRDVPMRRYGEKNLTDLSYSVGFLMFQELESKMGEPALDAALRDCFQQHKRGVTTEDLHETLRKHGAPEALWERWMSTTGWRDGC